MNKRHKKKMNKKRIIVIADETNLLTMTEKEREKAYREYETFKNKYTYRKKYKNLKAANPLYYFFSVGEYSKNFYAEMSKISRRTRKTNIQQKNSVQSFKDLEGIGREKTFAQYIYEAAHPDNILKALSDVDIKNK